MRKLFLLLTVLFALAAPVYAQEVNFQTTVITNTGRLVAGAIVTICNHNDNAPNPCTNTAGIIIYKNVEGTITLPNPTTTDGYGNIFIFLPAGTYDYSIAGNGIQTQTFKGITLSVGGGSSGNGPPFPGPNPWFDPTAYGARPISGGFIQTTASCINGSHTIPVSGGDGTNRWLVGDGIMIWGCGATEVMVTPSAPTVRSGQSETETVPDAILASQTGSSTYVYSIFGVDFSQGVTPASPATTITNGLATLGKQQFTISTESLTGSTLTVNTTTSTGIQIGTLVHVELSSNPALSGWFQVATTPSGTSFTAANIPITVASTLTSTGGQITFFAGNQVTFTGDHSVFKYGMCGKRPGDSVIHFLGYTAPMNGDNYPSSTTWTDWGSPMTTPPVTDSLGPVSDARCTSATPVNDFLATTVTAIGSTSLTLATPTLQNATAQNVSFTNGPALLAAATAAHAFSGGQVYIPPDSNATIAIRNSVDLHAMLDVSINQSGRLYLGDTLWAPPKWTGLQTAGSLIQFQNMTTPVTFCSAWPCVYSTQGSGIDYDGLTLSDASGHNQNALMIWDNGDEGGQILNSNFDTGAQSNTDLTGIGLWVRPAPFIITLSHLTFNSGPSNSGMQDSSFTPSFYMDYGTSGSLTSSSAAITDLKFEARTMYQIMNGSGPALTGIAGAYAQGGNLPTVAIQDISGADQATVPVSSIVNDTSPQPLLALWGALQWNIVASGMTQTSIESGIGFPPYLTGIAPTSFVSQDAAIALGLIGGNPIDIHYVNAAQFGTSTYYANDAQDAGTFSASAQGLLKTTFPIESYAGSFVPLSSPTLSIPTVSSGGSIVAGTYPFCVVSIGPRGGFSEASCQPATTSGGNLTVNLSWSSVAGANGGYLAYMKLPNYTGCLNSCGVITGTTLTVTTIPPNGGPINIPNAPGDGTAGYDPIIGLFGPQTFYTSGLFHGISIPTTLTANRQWLWPDKGGTVAMLSDVGAAPPWSAVTAGVNSNAGLFGMSGNTWDVSAALATIPNARGLTAALPVTCTVGQTYFATDATAGQNLYYCTATNVFTQQLNSGAAGANQALSNLSGVALNASLIPGSVNTVALGSAPLPFTNGFFGTVANQAGSFNTANLTANHVINWPNATSTTIRDTPAVSNQFMTACAVATGICSQTLIPASATTPNAYAGDSGTSTAYVVTLSPVPSGLSSGLTVSFLPANANTTTTPTMNLNGLGAKTITKFGTAAAAVGDLITTQIATVVYDGTDWELQNPSTLSLASTASNTQTYTNKTLNCESTGNVCGQPALLPFQGAGCNNSTSGPSLDLGTTNAPTPACAGTTVRKGVLQFTRGNVAYFNSFIPNDYNSSAAVDIYLTFTTTDTTNGHVTSFNIQTGCNAVNGTVTDDPSLNALQALSVTTGASQISGGQLVGHIAGITMTGCSPGFNFEVAITRNNSGTDTNTDTAVAVKNGFVIMPRLINAANR